MERNFVGWFEIPVNDIHRASSFYEAVFDTTLTQMDLGKVKMASFQFVNGGYGAGGSLMQNEEHYTPSPNGVVIYFGTKDINKNLDAVRKNGGEVIQEKKAIGPDQGFNAVFLDTEGNRIALHQTN